MEVLLICVTFVATTQASLSVSNDQTKSDSYDFIIVGSGSSGSVIASRLSENPTWNILLLEAGGDPVILSRVPLLAPLVQLTRTNWFYFTEPEENACKGYIGNRCTVARGKVLGGSSQLYYMYYSRGHPKSYNTWAEMGNEGWSYGEVLKYFIKSEGTVMKRGIDTKVHGFKGLQTTSYPQWKPNQITRAFLESWKLLGYKQVDYNGYNQVGYSDAQTFTENGERADVVTEFLKPFRNRTNLVVLKNSLVTKILIDNTTTAYGVEYVKDGKKFTATANKEVIVSAGSINSPQLLMLSGIGLSEDLSSFGIPVVQNLSVGQNLQDHVAYAGFRFKYKTLALDPLNPLYFLQWLLTRKGTWAVPAGFPAVAFMNTKDHKNDYPDAEYILGIASSPINNILYNRKLNYVLYDLKNSLGPSFTIVPVAMGLKSRGYVKLRSTNPFDHPIIKGNYLQHPDDTETIVRAIRYSLKIAQSEPFRKLGVQVVKDKLPDCKQYDYDTHEYWVCAARHLIINMYHVSGTCKMGPKRDAEAVVDDKLQVHGVNNLRVADVSIVPLLPNCHTHAVALMIGEKASDMIKEKWTRK